MRSNYIIILFLLLLSNQISGQCNVIKQAIIFIQSSLVSDIYYYCSWEPRKEDKGFIDLLKEEGVDVGDTVLKEKIKEPIMWYMQEKLPFDIVNQEDSTHKAGRISVEVPNQVVTSQEQANYLLFTSDIYNDQFIVKLLYNRDPGFNLLNSGNEYEKWSRMNSGMVYLFQLNKEGCIINVSKKYESVD